MAINPRYPLDEEEKKAISGFWSAELDLDDGHEMKSIYLGSNGNLVVSSPSSTSSVRGSWKASSHGRHSRISIRMVFGSLVLSGYGERNVTSEDGGLRCIVIGGVVQEGMLEPCCVGKFSMRLSLPDVDENELVALDTRHKIRVAARPASPSKFQLNTFVGRWRLLIQFDDNSEPEFSTVTLNANRKFNSEETKSGVCLGGHWGVWDKDFWMRGGEFRKAARRGVATLGTHIWLEIDRNSCKRASHMSAEDVSMWGEPSLETMEEELKAKAPDGGSSDSVSGRIYFGAFGTVGSAVQGGRFSLIRESSLIR